VGGATKDIELKRSVYSYKINIVCLREKRKRNGETREEGEKKCTPETGLG
jgi:hypothetical protein